MKTIAARTRTKPAFEAKCAACGNTATVTITMVAVETDRDVKANKIGASIVAKYRKWWKDEHDRCGRWA